MTGRKRRYGWFRLAINIARAVDGEAYTGLFAGFVPVAVQPQYDVDEIHYYGFHEQFAEIAQGERAPEYRATFCAGSAVPRWDRVAQEPPA